MHDLLRHAKIILGIGVCAYEAASLAVNDPETLPRITDLSHRHRWLGWSIAAWCVAHLALPGLWPLILRWLRRVRP